MRIHKENTQVLCETNYQMLILMLPDITLFEHVTLASNRHDISIMVDVLERTPYTVLINLKSFYENDSAYSPETNLQVRIYHDANVAEVIAVQGHQRIRSHYAYPNSSMYLPDEKRQSNKLLAEILFFCQKNNFTKTYLAQQIEFND